MLKPSLNELIKSSFRSILKNKGRTFLTSLGIIIGVTSVILLTSIGNGLKKYVNDQFDSLGANTIFISPGQVFDSKGGFSGNPQSRLVAARFKLRDINALERKLRTSQILPLSLANVDIKTSSTTEKNKSLVGVTSEYGSATNSLPQKDNGRWFTSEEEDKKSPVAVLGYQIALDLFPNSNPLNKKIVIKGKNFKIIGVVDKKGSTFGGPSLDDYIFTPIDIVFTIAGNQDIQTISVKVPSKDMVPTIKNQITDILIKQNYDKDAFSVFDSSQLLNSINAIIGTLTVALTGIAAISLVVGGIGIMNIMLVTVTERTKEIGLRKAIGAYPRAILLQFLFEAIMLSAVGGIIGLAIGTAGTLAINKFFPAEITFSSVALALGVSSAVGIVFGVAPARKASKLSPIEALRYE